jgi:16S rRNA (cytosine967-C5)-methyltransferase
MCLRVNVRRISRADYQQRLEAEGLASDPGWQPESLILRNPVAVRELPGYAEGLVSVQDSGAMFAADVLAQGATVTGDAVRILDACAAPGGKLFHLAERYPSAALTGLEPNPSRLSHLEAEAGRLGHSNVSLRIGDATGTDWNQGEAYEAILVDAPCSGSGTLRRHPDIKVLRSENDLDGYRTLQKQLITNLFPLVAPGGVLVYCTCSLFPEENDDIIGAFLEDHPHAVFERLSLPTGMPTRFGWQLLPLPADAGPNKTVDGFYFSRLRARPPAAARAQGEKAG